MATRLYKAGWATTDTPGDIVHLYASVNTSGNYNVFSIGTSGSYQVPASKTLYITDINMYSSNANIHATLYYGDTAVTNSAAAPTNAIQISTSYASPTANTLTHISCFIAVPAQKYPHIRSGNSDGLNINVTGIVV